jgi:hypothetical protein
VTQLQGRHDLKYWVLRRELGCLKHKGVSARLFARKRQRVVVTWERCDGKKNYVRFSKNWQHWPLPPSNVRDFILVQYG